MVAYRFLDSEDLLNVNLGHLEEGLPAAYVTMGRAAVQAQAEIKSAARIQHSQPHLDARICPTQVKDSQRKHVV
jgi:hypothetical protein